MAMGRKLMLVTLCLAMSIGHAFADWQESYLSYQQAMQEGDRDAAERHAREAWQGSREAMPPSENRALLAQNYAALAVLTDPQGSVEALDDAILLAEEGFGTGNFDRPTLSFIRAEVLSQLRPTKRRPMREAVKALDELSAKNRTLTVPLQLQLRLIDRLHEARLWPEVIEVAGSTSDLLGEMDSTSPALAVQVEAFRTHAVLKTQPESNVQESRFARNLEATRQRYVQIGSQIGPQPSIDEFDETLARVQAYLGLIRAFQASYGHPSGERAEDGIMSTAAERSCAGETTWEKRSMSFPRSQYGTNAAVLIGYHIDEAGRVTEPRILGEVPMASPFGERVLQQISKWEADVDGLSEVCRRDRTNGYPVHDRPLMHLSHRIG
ncbi:hypothetical protein [Parvularcula maris]|uniref:TonB C-terminal domain-containing protein n=1 Tax=Parvularcula maris TaxID=2965077 RepID=A0A9X2LAR5_9PROT|nr:hypothetical protein [Parvularcula maris]MCQ8186192.1 hypothetical protein [Parvularcula maris]